MRIDLTPKGQIVGTRKVGENGHVTGLDKYAGKEILILVPNGRPVVKNTLTDYMHEWQRIAERNTKRAAKEWRAFQKRVPKSPEAALKLAKAQMVAARDQLEMPRLVARLPVAKVQRDVEKRLEHARMTVGHARAWIEARVPRLGAPTSRRKAAKKTAA
jgi:hypothetical protein